MKHYWLMKSEPSEVSVDDAIAAPKSTVAWTGVRNYQARNFMRDLMRVDDGVLFYHSSCAEPGIVGIGRVASTPYPDPTQFDRKSKYYDPKSTPEQPRWQLVDVQVTKKIPNITLAQLRRAPRARGDVAAQARQPPVDHAGGGQALESDRRQVASRI